MKNLNRINIGGLRAVEAAARTGHLANAAAELGVTPGAVSQQIIKAEQIIGRKLFVRRPKGLEMTPICREMLPKLTLGMSELSRALDIAEGRDTGVLVVSTAPVFAAKWLVWRLSEFNARHPGIRVRIDASVGLVDPNASDVDVCIRVGRGEWAEVEATRLVDQRVFPVCNAKIAESLTNPEDLASVPIIRDQGEMFPWSVWLGPNGLKEDMLGSGPVFSDASLCVDAAIAGQGVFLGWDTLAVDAISSKRLVAPFPGRFRNGLAYWFVVGKGRRKKGSLEAFEKWLIERMNSECCPGMYLS
jgi:DNA-binding transcriptional LysR family regulator